MNDLTKELLEALKGLMALSDHRVDLRDAAKAAREAIARAEAALAEPQPDAEEHRLRRMLCLRCHGVAAYMDDGEATFGGDEFQRPTDYLRESLDSIEQAWIEAVMKEAASVLGKPPMRGCELRDDAVGVFKP